MDRTLPPFGTHDVLVNEVAAGGQVHRHHHPEEEVWHIIDGAAEITLGDEVRAAAA
jgi:quercetin dioxygenase-like cupin family protein